MARRHQGGQGGADRLRVVEPAHQFADELQLPLARAPLRDGLRRSYRSQQIFRQRHPPQLRRGELHQVFAQILQGGGLPLTLAFARRPRRFRVIRFFIEVVVVHVIGESLQLSLVGPSPSSDASAFSFSSTLAKRR